MPTLQPIPPRPSFPAMGRFWTAANALSLARAVLVAPITVLVYRGGPVGPMFGLIALAIATDFFDGKLARWSDTVSEWGKALDATADKLAGASVTLALLVRPAEPNLPLWFVALAVSRDALLAAGGLMQTRRLGRFTTSLWSGKIAVAMLALTVVSALLGARPRLMEATIWATAAVMLFSVADYAVRYYRIMRPGSRARVDEHGHVVFPED